MTQQTPLEALEEQAEKLAFGTAKGIGGGTDHVLIDGTVINTNKVTAGSRQSELRIAWLWFYKALVAKDNILIRDPGGKLDGCGLNDHVRHYRDVPDPDDQTGARKVREFFQVDYWHWMVEVVDDKVITHQLTIWGYSRKEFMKHYAAIASINGRDQGGSGGGLVQQISQWTNKQ